MISYSQHKDKIKEMHIHDFNKEFGGHQIVGTGFIDFHRFKTFVNNNVFLNFEVRQIEAAKQSKEKFRIICQV